MPVVVIVAVVVAQNPPIIRPAEAWIDIGETVLQDFSILTLPDFFLQPGAPAGPFQIKRLIHDLLNERLARGPLPPQNSA